MNFHSISSPPPSQAEVLVNENFALFDAFAVFARDYQTTSGLVWGYLGGTWGGVAIDPDTITLAASSTNYIFVDRTTGAIATSTGTTEWNNADDYARVYVVTTGSATITGYVDHRAGPGGLFSGSGLPSGVAGAQVGDVNVFTKNQSVAPVALTDGATISTDASLSNNFKVTIAGNRTLANPTNLTDGMVLNWRVKQDGTGSRTLAFGSKFKWPGGVAPIFSTAAGSVDRISGIYDSTDDVIEANTLYAFA